MVPPDIDTSQIARYRDIVRLVAKYGRGDLLREAGIAGKAPGVDVGGVGNPEGAEAAKARDLARDLECMGPVFIKLGQLLSTRTDLLPRPYATALSRLQDQIGVFPYDEVEEVIEAELGMSPTEAFAAFDPVPIAAGSLGQVHQGMLSDGRRVAVKVRRPGVVAQVKSDLQALSRVAYMIGDHTDIGHRYGVRQAFDQFRDSLMIELDYRREASNLLAFSRSMRSFDRITTPRPIRELSGESVLTMNFIEGAKVGVGALGPGMADGSELAEELFRAYLRQILVDGFFHADPHPGNVLITPEGNLGLIDLGMVGRIPPGSRTQLVKLLLSASESHASGVVEAAVAIGKPLEHFDEQRFGQDVTHLMGSFQGMSASGLDSGALVMELARSAAASGLRMPPHFALLGKALLNLDLVAATLDPDFEPAAALRRHTAEIMRSEIAISKGSLLTRMVEAKDLVEQLPFRLNRLTEAVSKGELEFRVKAFDETEMLRSLQKLANRLTMGVVIAALVIGGALLARVPTTVRIAGYPALAVGVFVVAVIGAMALLASIVRADRELNTRWKKRRSSRRRGL